MTITTTAKNIRRGDRIQNWGPAVRDLKVNRVFCGCDRKGEYPRIEFEDGSEMGAQSWASELEVIR